MITIDLQRYYFQCSVHICPYQQNLSHPNVMELFMLRGADIVHAQLRHLHTEDITYYTNCVATDTFWTA